MSRSLEQILCGRKVYQGKVLPQDSDINGSHVVVIDEHLGRQYSCDIFSARFAIPESPEFFLKVPAAPLAETHKHVENEIAKLEQLACKKNALIPVIQKTFLAANKLRLPFYLTNISIPTEMHFEQLQQGRGIAHIEALTILYLTAKALVDIESCGIVHGGINSTTVQFYGKKLPFITDWSTAKTLDELPTDSIKAKFYETPTWLPPEVFGADEKGTFFNLAHVTPKVDIWSLGLLFMYLLTGKKLFAEDSPEFAQMQSSEIEEMVYNFFQGKNIRRYRMSCDSILKQMYLQSSNPDTERYFLDEIYRTLRAPMDLEPEIIFALKKYNIEQMIFNRDRLFTQKKQFLIKEFYINALLYVFDLCVCTNVKRRIEASELVTILEFLFPDLPNQTDMLSKKPIPPLFKDLMQNANVTKRRTFGSVQEAKNTQRRARPRHSMKSVDPNRVRNLLDQELDRYLSKE